MKKSLTRLLAILGIISILSPELIAGGPSVDVGPDTMGCPGDTLMIIVNISGGTPPYSYTWMPSANVVDPNSGNSGIIVDTTDRTYILSVTDASFATFVDTIKIESEWINIDAGPDMFLNCGSTSGLYSPIISGSAFASFLWNTGSTNFFFSGLKPGVYCVTATNNFGCQSEDCFIIYQNPTGQDIAIGSPSQICAGESVELTNNSEFIDSIGMFPISNWTWDPGDSSGTVNTFGSLNHTYSIPGTYYVTLTMTAGACVEKLVQSIEVIDCNQGSSCTPDLNLVEPGLSPDQDLLPCIDRGVYYDEVIQFVNFDTLDLPSPLGLRVVDSIRLKRILNLPCGISWQTNNANHIYYGTQNGCIGLFGTTFDSVGQYSLEIIADAWLRSPTNGTIIKITNGMLSVFGLDYAVRVKNAQDTCWTLDTMFVDYPSMTACQGKAGSLSIVLDGEQAVCDDGNLQLSPQVYGGNGLLEYTWSPSEGLSCVHCPNPVVSIDNSTDYTLSVQDYAGRSGSAQVNIGVSSLSADLGPDTMNLTCGQFFVNLTPALSGGLAAPVTYSWNTSETSSIINVPAGTYSVTVTNGYGCSGTSDITITVDSALSFDAGMNMAICDSGQIVVTLSPTILTEGSGNYLYNWTPTSSLNNPLIFMPTATIDDDVTYTLTILDQNNSCMFTDSVSFDFSYLEIDAGNDITIQDGEQDTLTPSIILDLGSGDYSYSWSPASDLSDPAAMNPVASPNQSTTYTLSVEDNENGCQFTDTVQVTVITGIEENEIGSSIRIYPNPNEGSFMISFLDGSILSTLRIYNTIGETVSEFRDLNGSKIHKMDVSHLSSGIYILEIETQTGIARKRLILQK